MDGAVKEPLRKALKKRLEAPHVPGCALHWELEGFYKIKLRKQGYRLVYYVDDAAVLVLVMAVARREDALVYRAAMQRIDENPDEGP